MATFHYKGYGPDGNAVAGTLEARGRQDAAARIREQGIFATRIAEPPSPAPAGGPGGRTGASFLARTTRQLSTLLAAGVPLLEALKTLAEEERGRHRHVLATLQERLAAGSSLHRAMEQQGGLFPGYYVRMVQAGEESGALERILARTADYLEHQANLRARIRSALIYPVFMTGVGILVLSFLFTFVIPKMVKIFSDTGAALPLITVILIHVSDLFTRYGWVLAAAAVLFLPLARTVGKKHRLSLDRLLLRLPGRTLQSLYCARFSRTMGFLLDGGIPLPRALKIAAGALGNRALEEVVLAADAQVAEGRRLSASLGIFPPVLVQLIATGEKSGNLGGMMNRAAQSYEEEFARRMERAVAFLEPVMILAMGIVVCFVVLAVLLPIFSLNQLVR